jgi:hypothetical protein
VVIPEARKRLMPKGPLTSSQSGNCPSITAVHDHGVGRTVLLQLMKQPVWLLQLEVRSGLSEAGRSRAGGSGLDRRGGKDGAWGRGKHSGCDRASESRIKVRLRDATPMRSIGMLDLREVLSAFGVEDEFMPQGRRYRRISCEMDIGIEAGSLEGTSVRVVR